eukprot:TRINITY_DN6724_c0_g1_i1.p1 TRINITY_DN6724_c0_g1~~TRINITY_DN6724_c0_g1_i1.p1  ORF type:complete len:622 (-),score=129.19 TRINITY_DN6724_c0_g1_i1:32-1897(-)
MKRTLLLIVVCLLFVSIIKCQSQSSSPTSISPTPSSSPSSISSGSAMISSSQSSSSSPSGSLSASSSPSLTTATPSPSIPASTARTYAVTFQPFSSSLIVDEDSLISYLQQALGYTSVAAGSPFSRRDLSGVETVYVLNVTSGSAFENSLNNLGWLATFNNISQSNVTSNDVAVFEVFASASQTNSPSITPTSSPLFGIPSLSFGASQSSSGSTSLTPSTTPSVTRSLSPSASPLANINVAVTFPSLVTNVINDTDELINIFAETLNITELRISVVNPAPGLRRDVPSQTLYVYDNAPAFAQFINTPSNWIARFNSLAGVNVAPGDIEIRQLASPTPSNGQTPSTPPLQGSCPFNFPFNSSTGICVLPGATLYLPFTGPMASDNLPDPSQNSLTVCITVNSPDCMVNPPITGRRQNTIMNSTCSQPFSRFWSQWDACLYDFAPYAQNQTFIDESNVANTCAANRTTTQISYLGAYYGNWSFSQQPCYNDIRTAKRQSPSEQCFCVPYPDSADFGVSGRTFFTELTVYQTQDSGVPASIRILCNDFPCSNTTTGLLPPDETIRYDSSNERALILGIVLGFGLPCLIYCIAAIIIAILILLLLLLLGKSTTAKTFWVPSRDDL